MIDEIRFRTENQLVILQVRLYEEDKFGQTAAKPQWRDAKVEDLLDVAKHIVVNSRRIEPIPGTWGKQ